MDFDPVVYAREELSPLLSMICESAEEDGSSEQQAFFASIKRSIDHATVAEDLADPFMALSTSAFLGFHYSSHVTLLLDLALERAQRLSEVLSCEPGDLH